MFIFAIGQICNICRGSMLPASVIVFTVVPTTVGVCLLSYRLQRVCFNCYFDRGGCVFIIIQAAESVFQLLF